MTMIGVLALQGGFAEHIAVLRGLGVDAQEVRRPQQLVGLDGLILPGGESTTIGRLAATYGLIEPIQEMARRGASLWGTCAGMVLLSKEIGGLDQPLVGVLDIVVRRNAFGRQVDSFEADLVVPVLEACGADGGRPFRSVFIRAPVVEATGEGVEVLAMLGDGSVVAVRQGDILATAFHPELTDDARFHRYFVEMTKSKEALSCSQIAM
jgi:5'-phosphate synthase pdxT subunit